MQDKNNTIRIFSSRLKSLMDSKPWKQKELAEAAQIGQSAISNYIQGTRLPGAVELLRLAKALNVSMEYLVTDDMTSDTLMVNEDQQAYRSVSTWKKRALVAEHKLKETKASLESILKKI